ncbi:hypothetical protein F2Q68_00000601 [Brassica cretica]|uniref:Uncharacterized protein n=1 Tax=Brassica cretica TaxID=69181 RepID=A0A8S9J6N4_BRACR|nr:hypothetical protein F2Q68_00000601 [Brassica cretica]
MLPRRRPLAVPKVRRVGFFTSIEPSPETPRPNRSLYGPAEAITSSSPLSDSPSGQFISPVQIPLSRHHSDNLVSRAAPVPVPGPSAFHQQLASDRALLVGSYNHVDSLLGTSPPSSNGEVSEDSGSLFSPFMLLSSIRIFTGRIKNFDSVRSLSTVYSLAAFASVVRNCGEDAPYIRVVALQRLRGDVSSDGDDEVLGVHRRR